MNEEILKLQKQIDQLRVDLNQQGQTQLYGVDFTNITNFIEIVETTPDVVGNVPDQIYEQIKIYYTAGTWKLFLYDRLNGVWKSVALT